MVLISLICPVICSQGSIYIYIYIYQFCLLTTTVFSVGIFDALIMYAANDIYLLIKVKVVFI